MDNLVNNPISPEEEIRFLFNDILGEVYLLLSETFTDEESYFDRWLWLKSYCTDYVQNLVYEYSEQCTNELIEKFENMLCGVYGFPFDCYNGEHELLAELIADEGSLICGNIKNSCILYPIEYIEDSDDPTEGLYNRSVEMITY